MNTQHGLEVYRLESDIPVAAIEVYCSICKECLEFIGDTIIDVLQAIEQHELEKK